MDAPAADLSPRQVEVLRGLCRGLTYEKIGEELGISMETVKKQLARIRAKVGLSTKVELALWAARNLREES